MTRLPPIPHVYARHRLACRFVITLAFIAALQLVRIAVQGGEPCCMPPSVASVSARENEAVGYFEPLED